MADTEKVVKLSITTWLIVALVIVAVTAWGAMEIANQMRAELLGN